MLLATYMLSQLLRICAPDVGARTMTAIVRVESGGNPLAIHDNTLSRSFAPYDAREAVAWARQLLALHHSVDLGLSQINSANLPRLGLSVPEAFDACTNLSAGSLILASDYQTASQRFGPGQYALRRAIGAYNSGSIYDGYAYVDSILAAAGLGASGAIRMPDLGLLGPSALSLAKARIVAIASPTPARHMRAKRRKAASVNPYYSSILVGVGLPHATGSVFSLVSPTPFLQRNAESKSRRGRAVWSAILPAAAQPQTQAPPSKASAAPTQ